MAFKPPIREYDARTAYQPIDFVASYGVLASEMHLHKSHVCYKIVPLIRAEDHLSGYSILETPNLDPAKCFNDLKSVTLNR